MTGSSWAGVISAVGTMLTAVGVVITALTVFLPMLRTVRTTHKLVNQQMTNTLAYQRALVRALVANGVDVPIDQSLPDNSDVTQQAEEDKAGSATGGKGQQGTP